MTYDDIQRTLHTNNTNIFTSFYFLNLNWEGEVRADWVLKWGLEFRTFKYWKHLNFKHFEDPYSNDSEFEWSNYMCKHDHSKDFIEMAAIFFWTIQKPNELCFGVVTRNQNHSPFKQLRNIHVPNVFSIWAPTVLQI